MPRTRLRLTALPFALAVFTLAAFSNSQPFFHTISRGENLSAIANRYHVSVHELAERNHLTEPYPPLRTGQRLRLPSHTSQGTLVSVSAPSTTAATAHPRGASTPQAHRASETPQPSQRRTPATAPRLSHSAPTARSRGTVSSRTERHTSRWGRPRRPGVVRLHRLVTSEDLTVQLRRPGRQASAALRRFLRSTSGASHAIDRRLMHALASVSDHFGGRSLEVISGFRPRRQHQWTRHSNHNIGRAIDFRVVGVRNRALWDYCRTLPNVGCGFYPRSVFIHMDVRSESAIWVDWSRPGQRPRYGRLDHPPSTPSHTSPATASTSTPSTPTAPTAPSTPAGDDDLDDVADDDPAVRTATPAPDDNQPDDNQPGSQPTPPNEPTTPPPSASAPAP